MRHCRAPGCSNALEGRRADASFCSATCRSRAFRSDRSGLADEVIGYLAPPAHYTGAGTGSVRAIAAALGSPDLAPVPDTWQGRVSRLERQAPELVSSFGLPAIVASARPLPAGVCRVCIARSEASVRKLPTPTWDNATMRLLGRPCSTCSGVITAALSARVHPAGRERALVASGALGVEHKPGTCATCYTASLAARTMRVAGRPNAGLSALVASAGIQHRVAPADRAVPGIAHNGRGAAAPCKCPLCTVARAASRPGDAR